MYICKDCAHVFEDYEVKRVKDYIVSDPYPDGPIISVCPNCDSEEIVEAELCAECGEYVPVEEMTKGFCSACSTKLMKKFHSLVYGNFTEKEIAVLNEMLDGEYI